MPHNADVFSLAANGHFNLIWVSYFNDTTHLGYTLVVNRDLSIIILPPTQVITGGTILNLASITELEELFLLYEVQNNYTYDSTIPSHFIQVQAINVSGALGGTRVFARGVGLASKVFVIQGIEYVLTTYQSPYQNTYFLLDLDSNVVNKFAYTNAGGYLTKGLPSVTVINNVAWISYLIKDLIQAVNKNTNVPAGSQVVGVYAQTGVNLIKYTFASDLLTSAEIGLNLNINSGLTLGYDGYSLVEQGFFLYPDSVEATWSSTGGNIAPQPDGITNINAYFYQVTYEWSDNQGNLFRSAPSIPISVTTTGTNVAPPPPGFNGTGSITINIPTLRLSLKNLNNPVKIVIYRWSVGQQVYYQTSSILLPTLNDPTIDSITFIDTNSDAFILGNNILYTTGGVLENIGPPTFDSLFLFDSRLWGIDAEDKNLLWFSKPIIEATPVEMSDLLTFFVSPTIGAQGSTGILRCGAAMDDKLILFKATAINYINGTGPDITGASNGYSPAIFITSTVGCSNQLSIVFQPQGLMFEFASEAGNQIWLLGRDLSTTIYRRPC